MANPSDKGWRDIEWRDLFDRLGTGIEKHFRQLAGMRYTAGNIALCLTEIRARYDRAGLLNLNELDFQVDRLNKLVDRIDTLIHGSGTGGRDLESMAKRLREIASAFPEYSLTAQRLEQIAKQLDEIESAGEVKP